MRYQITDKTGKKNQVHPPNSRRLQGTYYPRNEKTSKLVHLLPRGALSEKQSYALIFWER